MTFNNWITNFSTPGIKVISFHPMNFTFNSPSLAFMRNIKDFMTRKQYQNIGEKEFVLHRNRSKGIRNFVEDIIYWVQANDYQIYTLNDLHEEIFNDDTIVEILLNQ